MTTPAGWYPDPDGSGGQRYWDGSTWTGHRSPETPAVDDSRRSLIIGFGAACAALLAILVVVIVYGVFFNMSTNIVASPAMTPGNGWGNSIETATETPAGASGSGPQASDGGLTFAITGVESAPSVQYQDAPVEKTAQGEFLIVHLNVLNSGDAQGGFLATLQKLKARGSTYDIDDEATAYLNGTWADLAPSDSADVAIAFDVPPGTTGESLEVHGEPMSAGVDIPLS